MFSISPAEVFTIAIIALILFGPRRLAEMARQAGKLTGELRRTADELRSGLQQELDEVKAPIDDLREDLAAAGKGLVETAEGELRWVEKPAAPKPAADVRPEAPAGEADPEDRVEDDPGAASVDSPADRVGNGPDAAAADGSEET